MTRRRGPGLALTGTALALVFAFTAGPGAQSTPPATTVLTGTLNARWIDGRPGTTQSDRIEYILTDDTQRRHRLLVDPDVAASAGGLLGLDKQAVVVETPAAASGGFGVASLSTDLRVTAISRAPSRSATFDVGVSAVTGAKPWITIMCKFQDVAATPKTLSYFQNMYANAKPGLDHYWRELSFNLANVSGSTATGWYTLTHPRSYYVYDMDADGFADLDFDRATADCTAAADATVNFSTYTGITMAFNDDLDGPATGGSMFLTLDGTTKSWGTTWLPPWAYQDINVVSHEMGHGFGLAHSSGNYGATYDNNWDVMSGSQDDCFGAAIDPTYGCMAPHTISYHKDLLGWMSGRRQDVAAGTTMTVPIDQLGATSAAMQEIKIPVASPSGNQKFYTVEARKHVGYDAKLPGEGVIIHFVDPSRVEPAHVMDSDGNGDNGDAGAIWVPGETFTDAANGVRITVNSATATGYSVTVTNGGAVNTIVDLDADGHGDAFIYKASSGVWAAQFSANVGGFTGTNGAWSPGWSVTPATFNTDALTDFFLINGSTGQWFRMTNLSGGAFSVQSTAAWSPTWQRFVVDLDGDGLSDVFLWNPTAGEWFKCLSTSGGGFTYVHGFWSAGWEVYPMRFNTDALQDFFLFNRSSGQWFWALGQAGSGFTYPASGFWSTGWQFYPGDYSGDGVTDLVLFTPANGFRFVATTGASGFTFTSGFFSTGFALYPLDLNADGRTDLFLHNASTGQWFEFTSSGTGTFTNSGNGTWTLGWSLLPSDFNGDRRGDLLLYNASTGVWFQARNLTLNAFTYNSGAWDTGLTVVANRGLP